MDVAVASAPKKDDAWFAAVYRAHVGYVWHVLRRLGVPEKDRADLAQDVFVVVHRHREVYDDSRPLKPWLFGIAFRIARRHGDKHSQRFEVLHDAFAELAPTENSGPHNQARQLEHKRMRERMQTALQTLDVDKRTAFLLCEIEGLSVVDAAALCDENVNTFGARLRAARQAVTAAVRLSGSAEGAVR